MKALISGISGQDGSYLAELLLEKGYEVHGIVRRHSVAENQDSRISKLDITTHYGDVTDYGSLMQIFRDVLPDEVYNLAAQSHVGISSKLQDYSIKVDGLGVLYMLGAFRDTTPRGKFYQAGSSEMFGNSVDSDGYQRVTTPMEPVSPYGCAKLLGYHLVRHYRVAYGLFACNGILFNHESPRRGSNFVTAKIVKGSIEIKKGIRHHLELGNLKAARDWGHARDYVRAMHMMMQLDKPGDWVVASGTSWTVERVCEYVFGKLGMDYKSYVVSAERYFRPCELNALKGDAAPIIQEGWVDEYTTETMLDEMIEYWRKRL